jgi:IPT/TIG domain
VTLTGQNFSTTAANNRVTFDGVSATVVSASATQLVVRPPQGVSTARPSAVSVEVQQQVSNTASFELVPSGTVRRLNARLIIPRSVVRVGTDLYVTSSYPEGSQLAGLYRITPDGRVIRVVSALPGNRDAPQALTTDGTDIYFTTRSRAVRRYNVATGQVSDVVAAIPPGPHEIFSYTWSLPAIARTPNGYFFVVDTSVGFSWGVQRISPSGQVTDMSPLGLSTARDLVADGTNVFVALSYSTSSVTRISNAEGAYTLTHFASTTDQTPLNSLTVVGNQLVAASSLSIGTRLLSVDKSTGGTLAPYGNPAGYGSSFAGMWGTPQGEIYVAQPFDGAVRKLMGSADTTTALMGAGRRLAMGVVRMNGRTYVSGISTSVLPPQPPTGMLNGTLAEFSEDGTGRLLATGGQFRGLVPWPGGRLAVSDCRASRIFTLDPATGSTADLLTAADGLTCPTGLVTGPTGELFYINSTPGGSTIGRYTSQGNNRTFVTGLPPESSQLTLASGRLLVMGLAGRFDDWVQATSLYSADAATGGIATPLLPPSLLPMAQALATSPSGVVYVGRTNGDILTMDAGGTLTPFTNVMLSVPPRLRSSRFHTFSFDPDGTAVFLDTEQGDLLVMAP